ncbi:hypothetical protein L218DRAFT_875127 [Marasmius fiardii PR-910]|nr:hypothetical protein L218DRAFT_875127 [Marasmius fiardii PR-910]
MFTSHIYKLPSNIEIFFTDSGPPPHSKDYKTLVIFHGACFNGFGLEKLHGVAHSLNLRTVIWNRRDYPGSTPYTDRELQDLQQGRKVFLDQIGREIGEFLAQFIENEDIPEATSDNTRGGIAIVGWSLGCITAMTLFSDQRLVPPKAYLKLEPYIKHLVLYEPPPFCFGYDMPTGPEYYLSFSDPDLKTPEAQFEAFCYWVSSFSNHPDVVSADHRGMDTRTKRSADATVGKWSPEEFERYANADTFQRSEQPM